MKTALPLFLLLLISTLCSTIINASDEHSSSKTEKSLLSLGISFYDPNNGFCWYKNDACNTSSGYIHPCVSGGTPPYIYLWSNGATTLNIDNIPAGTYSLTVYDAVGDSAIASQVITNGPVDFTFVAPPGLPCYNQCNGTVVYNPFIGTPPGIYFNGTAPYTFTTTQGTILNDWDAYTNSYSPGVTTITNICSGVSVTVTTTDANGCTGQETFTFYGTPLHNPTFSINPACNSLPNGSVTVSNLNTNWGSGLTLEIITDTLNWTCPPGGGGSPTMSFTQNNLLPGDYFLAISHSPTNLNCNPGIYIGCPQFVPFTIPDLGPSCSSVQGNVFVDLNSNCSFDAGEVGIPGVILEFTPGPFYTMTNSSGSFSTNLPVGTYTVTQQLPPNLFQTCASAPSTFTILAGTPNYLINFADSSNIPLDVEAYLGSGIARPGFDFTYSLYVKNYSYQPSGLLDVTFDYDPLLTFVSANPAPMSTSPGQITWQLSSLSNFQQTGASVTLNVPANPALIGDTLTASVNVQAGNPENNLTNNSKILKHIITGSFDPNDKQVHPQGVFLPALNNKLNYTIQFQNTGNDTAFTVVIIDTLDTNLDVTTLIPGAASHPYETELSGAGIITFTFNNIMLPDSIVDEPGSHGFISFEINTKDNLPHNTIISNTSDIYFDFNPPITTNTVQSNVDLSLAIQSSSEIICEGEQVTLNIIPELQNAANSWIWREYSCIGTVVGIGNSIIITPGSTTTYFVRDSSGVISINSCFQKTITVLPASASSQTISICFGESYSIGSNIYSVTGIYFDTLTSFNGCDSIVTTNLTVQPPIDTTLMGIDFLIISNALSGTYQWVDCDNNFDPIPGETGNSFYPLIDGNYGVIITQNGCTDTSECVQIIGIGISEMETNKIKVYPNPTNGFFTIESGSMGKYELIITNSIGEIISETEIVKSKTEIDLTKESKGVYLIKIIQEKNTMVLKVIYL